MGIAKVPAGKIAFMAKVSVPSLIALGGLCMIVGGLRLQQGRSFMQRFAKELEPLPAFESGVIFKLGDVKLSLRDTHTGIGAFGGIGSGKSSYVNALISTTYGKIRLGDLDVGDKVLSPSNKEQEILKIIPVGQQKLWTLTTEDGLSTQCSSDHLWLIKQDGLLGEALTQTGSIAELLSYGKNLRVQTAGSNFQWKRIVKVTESTTKGECRCLVLSGTEHLYIADGIVTHNCLDPEQDLLMFDGTIKKVKDVIPGDLLMGPDNKARRVQITSTGYGPLYRITPIKGAGRPWICNDAHILTLRYTSQGGSRPARTTPNGVESKNHLDRKKHYKGITQVFGEIPNKKVGRYYQKILEDNNFIMDVCITDFINRKAPSRRLDLFWKLFRPKGIEFPDLEEHDPSRFNYTHKALNLEEFYLSGTWIGDGFITSGWCSEDNEIKNAVKHYLTQTADQKRDIRIQKPHPHNQNFERIYPRKLGTSGGISNLEKYLLEFTTATLEQKSKGKNLSNMYRCFAGEYDKDIPHWALTATREKRLALLAGILDTDGSLQIEGRCFDLTQKRKTIVEKVVWLCRSLGLAASEPYESWKECTNQQQNPPSIDDLIKHPILLQELIDRANLKISLQLREGLIDIDSAEALRNTINKIRSREEMDRNLDGYLRYEQTKKVSILYFEKSKNLIDSIKILYKASVGILPRKEVIIKFIANNSDLQTLIKDIENTNHKVEFEKELLLAYSYLNDTQWNKLHISIQTKHLLEGGDAIPFDIDALHQLLAFHQNEPRERYWRTTISGDIEKIPTRVKHKQLTSVRPEKRADGRGFEGVEARNTKDPLCFGWDAEPIGEGPYCGFTLDGDGRFLLGDFTVTHNTVSMMVPLMRQFFRQLNDDDDTSEYAKCGALILDEKGDFIDSTITEMRLAGRSLQDLVLIDPDLDLYRYNPLDPNQTADENAAKLAKVQKILGTTSGGDNAYWDQTSQATIKYFLQLLEVYKPKHKIGLDDIARFMRDDDMATILCDTVEETIIEKKNNNEISEEAYGSYMDAVSATRNAWIHLNPNTKSTLKTTITNMLGPIAQNPKLQKVFCRDTNFSFRDLPNKGKVVLFRGSGIDKSTARLICVCLKIDFQTWQKRRNGSSAAAFGLNTNRTVVFICDEYQEFVTCGGEGDETFYGVSRSTRTAPIVATQSYNSLETAIKNKEQTKTLRQNIATWVFFRSTDQETCDLGKFLAGQSKKEDYSTSQDTTGLLETASNLAGGGGGKGSSISISRKLEENFRTDDFSRLVTMTMEKSKTGPWYSEAIVYHYHDVDDSAESRCYKTRLTHLYYDSKLRKQASLNVQYLDHILYDRNWQRKAMQRGLILIQRSVKNSEDERMKTQQVKDSQGEVQEAKRSAAQSPEIAEQQEKIKNILQRTSSQKDIDNAELRKREGMQGAFDYEDEDYTIEQAQDRIARLEQQTLETTDPSILGQISVMIGEEKKRIARMKLEFANKDTDTTKEVLRADMVPMALTEPNEDEDQEYLENRDPLEEGDPTREGGDEDTDEDTDEETDEDSDSEASVEELVDGFEEETRNQKGDDQKDDDQEDNEDRISARSRLGERGNNPMRGDSQKSHTNLWDQATLQDNEGDLENESEHAPINIRSISEEEADSLENEVDPIAQHYGEGGDDGGTENIENSEEFPSANQNANQGAYQEDKTPLDSNQQSPQSHTPTEGKKSGKKSSKDTSEDTSDDGYSWDS